MSSYSFALLVHLLALVAAFGAATVLHLAMVEARLAETGRDALRWLGIAHRFSRVFPVAIAALVASGAWMVHRSWSWSAGFVDAGLAGVVLLGLCGDVVAGRRAGAIARTLSALPAAAPHAVAADRLWWCASFANTGIALGVVVTMVVKPSPAAAAAVVAVGLCLGAAAGAGVRRLDRERPGRAVDAAA